ncbi:hypothetical protein B0J17DRAFT_633855 [Rhizoctonia solani]|nr:hypothetical protein B0J17DRAFT_633855 [Rhizoctonia solani]
MSTSRSSAERSQNSPARLRDTRGIASAASFPSAKSYITSASELATKPDEFTAWVQKVKLDSAIKKIIPESTIFQPVRDLPTASTKFPRWLTNPNAFQFCFISPSHLAWRDLLCSTLRQPGCRYSTSDNGDPDLPFAVLNIFQICCQHEEIRSLNSDGLGSETDTRVCINTLLIHYSEADRDGLVRYSTKQELRLPVAIMDKVEVATTMAGGIMILPVINFGPYVLRPDLRTAASAIPSTPEIQDLFLMHCIAMLKGVDSGENQMKMGMFDRDFIRVTAGSWQEVEIKIYEAGAYSLRAPESLIEFYLILRGIKRLAASYTQQLTQSGPALLLPIQNKQLANEWSPARMAPMCGSAVESNGQAPRTGSSIQQGLSALGKWEISNRISEFRHSTRLDL